MSRTKTTFARRALASVGAAALGLMGVVGLSTSAFATEGGDTTPPVANYGNIDVSKLGSLTINKVVGTADDQTPINGVTFTIQKCTAFDITDPADWAKITVANPTGTECGALEDTGSKVTGADSVLGQAKFDSLAVGAYWVTESDRPENVDGSVSFWVTIPMPQEAGWNYDVVVNPKNTITGAGSKTANTVDVLKVGAIVNWTLTSPVLGSEGLKAGSKSFNVDDTYGAYQTYVDDSASLKVTQPGGTVTTPTGLQVTNDATSNKVTFVYDWSSVVPTYPAGTKFEITYETRIESLPSEGEIKNATNWGSDATYWGSFKGLKKSTSGQTLKDAEFAIYAGACPSTGVPTGTPITTVKSDVDGVIDSGQLFVAKGTENANVTKPYCLVETKAPAGFVLPDPAFTETVNLAAGQHSVTLAEITNTPVTGPTLPTTGASGTMLMTMGGIGLVAVAGGLYLATRRKAHQE